jgi:glycosyltransferase involved in cell wall biosynthesis
MAAAGHRISVVIPCYNDGRFLPEALASLRGQEPCDLVVVDDGSSDRATLALLDELSRSGVRVLRQANAGVSAARMAGVHAAATPYVFPLDADDLVAAGALTALADALDASPGAAAAWGHTEIFGIGEGILRLRAPEAIDPWLITYVNDMPLAALLRRDRLLSVGGWQLLAAHEDWDVWMAFAERGWTGVRIDHVVEIHRQHAARRWARVLAENPQHEALLRQRHASLFAQRALSWKLSRAPWRTRFALPLIGALGFLSDANKQRLYQLVHHPARLLRIRVLRLRQRLRNRR